MLDLQQLTNDLILLSLSVLYYFANKKTNKTVVNYKNFFFPLDFINFWNKAYGKKGFFQYQFVIPNKSANIFFSKFIKLLTKNNEVPALTVLKSFGSIASIGDLSFPREGVTLAIDFPNRGSKTIKFMEDLDNIVIQHGGALYPAKDARMSKKVFSNSFPNQSEFIKNIDPHLSSFFWERVK